MRENAFNAQRAESRASNESKRDTKSIAKAVRSFYRLRDEHGEKGR